VFSVVFRGVSTDPPLPLKLYLFSVKAPYQLAARIRNCVPPISQALKARFNAVIAQQEVPVGGIRYVESRFQRSTLVADLFPGALPQATNDAAPLALNRYERGRGEPKCSDPKLV
jgi:hypothetical protein